jgi:hypothetical protein
VVKQPEAKPAPAPTVESTLPSASWRNLPVSK